MDLLEGITPHFNQYGVAALGWPVGNTSVIVPYSYAGVPFPGGVHRDTVPLWNALLDGLTRQLGVKLMNPGCWGYNNRSIRSGGSVSFHAAGLALDVNAPANPYVASGGAAKHSIPDAANDLARSLGMEWGGAWSSPKDYMHFEIHLTPAEVRTVAARLKSAQSPTAPSQNVPAPVSQRSAVDVLAEHGMQRPAEVVEIATTVGVDLAAACAMLVMETGDRDYPTFADPSGGGRNVWGGDNVAGRNVIYKSGSEVTPEVYAKYIAAVRAGKAGRQGVGPTQLTWGGYQDECDKQGGTWDWRTNVRYGLTVLRDHIKAKGLQGGFVAYNGGAQYGVDAMKVYQVYKQRLVNTTTTPEDDMTPEQDKRLARVEHALEILIQQVCGERSTIENPFPGGANGGGWECHDGERRTLVDIGRHGLEKLDG